VADFEVTNHLDGDHCVVRVIGGEHDGRLVVVSRGGDPAARHLSWFLEGADPSEPIFDRNTPDEVARTLLESLLSKGQLADWSKRGRFWVETPRGSIELGRLYSLRFRDRNGDQLVLCVVPEDEIDLPNADIWTTLLLVLRTDPERFFDVANWRKHGSERWCRGPVPFSESRIKRAPRQHQSRDSCQGTLFNRDARPATSP
jgi:hypothetical protein